MSKEHTGCSKPQKRGISEVRLGEVYPRQTCRSMKKASLKPGHQVPHLQHQSHWLERQNCYWFQESDNSSLVFIVHSWKSCLWVCWKKGVKISPYTELKWHPIFYSGLGVSYFCHLPVKNQKLFHVLGSAAKSSFLTGNAFLHLF